MKLHLTTNPHVRLRPTRFVSAGMPPPSRMALRPRTRPALLAVPVGTLRPYQGKLIENLLQTNFAELEMRIYAAGFTPLGDGPLADEWVKDLPRK